jgi:hypothetical protein
MKKICERCYEDYEEGEIYPSKYFPYVFCIPCEKEYEHRLWQFRVNFINNQPERLSEKNPKEYCGQLPDYPRSLKSTQYPEG